MKTQSKKILTYLGCASLLILQGCATLQTSNNESSITNEQTLKINHADPLEASEKQPIYQLLLAELAIRKGHNTIAVNNYLEALKNLDNAEIAERTTKIAIHAKDLDSALFAAKRWQQIEPDNYKPYQISGTLLLRQGLTEEAFNHYQQTIDLRATESRLSFVTILSILSREQVPSNILTVSQQLADHYHQNAYAQYMHGALAAKFNKAQESLTYLNKALAQENIPNVHGIKAKQLLKLGKRTQALDNLAVAVKNNPDNNEIRMAYARLLIDVKQYNAARIEFSKLLKVSPNDADLIYTLGLLSLEADLLDDAEHHLTKLLTIRHRRDEAIYYLGRISESKKDLRQAVKWYSEVNHNSLTFDANIRSAKLFARMGETEKASEILAHLKITHQNESSLVLIFLAEGAIYREAHQYEQAMAVFNQALLKIPNHSDLLYARALISEKIGRMDILEQDILTILAAEPNNAHALNALGFSLIKQPERLDEAHQYIKRAMNLAPNEAAIIDSMGWVEFKRGNTAQAETLLRKAYNMLKDSEIAAHLGEVLWVQGKHKEAQKLLQNALKNEPDSSHIKEVMQRLIP